MSYNYVVRKGFLEHQFGSDAAGKNVQGGIQGDSHRFLKDTSSELNMAKLTLAFVKRKWKSHLKLSTTEEFMSPEADIVQKSSAHSKNFAKIPDFRLRVSGKRKIILQKALNLSQNLLSESSHALTDNSSDEEVPANYLLKFSLDF
ncbi:hypothetical protein TNCV_4818381 [Trichonephila clavipes]|nr:hypothetical protein TNCV_4818381 [Trichonephila clavipes]